MVEGEKQYHLSKNKKDDDYMLLEKQVFLNWSLFLFRSFPHSIFDLIHSKIRTFMSKGHKERTIGILEKNGR